MSSFQTAQGLAFRKLFYAAGAVTASMRELSICRSGTQCPLYSAASLREHVIGPHANPPSHIILTPGRPVMFHGPFYIVSTMQAGTTHIFNVYGMTGPSSNRELNPQILLVSAKLVPPIVTFYNQQGLLRTYSSPGSSIRSPHQGSSRGKRKYRRFEDKKI